MTLTRMVRQFKTLFFLQLTKANHSVLLFVSVTKTSLSKLTNAGGSVSGKSVAGVTDTVEATEQVDAVTISTDTSHLSTFIHIFTTDNYCQVTLFQPKCAIPSRSRGIRSTTIQGFRN